MKNTRIVNTVDLWRFLITFLAAMMVRCVAWILGHGPFLSSDSNAYLQRAKDIADGHWLLALKSPFTLLYAACLSPIYLFDISIPAYAFIFNCLVSSLVCIAGLKILSEWPGLSKLMVVSYIVLSVTYPRALFWTLHVGSDNFFSLFLLIFCLMSLRYFQDPTPKRFIFFCVAALLIPLMRAPGAAVSGVGILFVLFCLAKDRFSRIRALIGVAAICMTMLASIYAVMDHSPTLRSAVLSDTSVSMALDVGAHLPSNDLQAALIDEKRRAEFDTLHGNAGLTTQELNIFRSYEAIQVIKAQPIAYLQKCVTRFISFWVPSIFATTWSRTHLIAETALSIPLIFFAVIGIARGRSRREYFLLTVGLTLSLVSAFSIIDTDGRYTLQGEVCLLPLTAIGLGRVFSKLVNRSSSRSQRLRTRKNLS